MKLNCRQYGTQGKSIIILHGLLGSSLNWNSIAKSLGEQFKVFVPDLRNHGESPHGVHSIELLSQDILELMNELQMSKAILVGHSMGGLAAMHFAFQHPDKLSKLIIVDIAPVIDFSNMNWILQALHFVELNKISSRQDADKQLQFRIPSQLVRQFLLQNLKRKDDGSYFWRCNLPELSRFIQDDLGFEVKTGKRYTGPTLFIGGEQSEHKIHKDENIIQRHFPNYQLKMIPKAGHWVHFEAPKEFIQIVINFVLDVSLI